MEHVEIFLLLPVYVEAGDQPGYLKRLELLGNKEYHEYIDAINRIKSFSVMRASVVIMTRRMLRPL